MKAWNGGARARARMCVRIRARALADFFDPEFNQRLQQEVCARANELRSWHGLPPVEISEENAGAGMGAMNGGFHPNRSGNPWFKSMIPDGNLGKACVDSWYSEHWHMLHVACCMLHVVCCMLHVAWFVCVACCVTIGILSASSRSGSGTKAGRSACCMLQMWRF